MKNKPTGKSVLLFSGGLDSYIISKLEKVNVLLYLPHRNRYEKAEYRTVCLLEDRGFLKGSELIIKENLDLGEFEREDAIIPLRNLFLLSMAALYGEKLYIGAVYGDRTLDKSLDFMSKLEDMLNYLYQEQHWCEERKFEVVAPYKEYTKTQLVAKYLEEGYPIEGLLTSFSCYDSKSTKPCNKCKPCVRKAVALLNNNIEVKGFKFKNVPWLQPNTEIYNQLVSGKNEYRGKEDEDFRKAMQL